MLDFSSSAQRPETRSVTPKYWRRLRLVPIAIAVLAIVLGLYTGLTRLGIQLPTGGWSVAAFHGALMISGFLGIVISLERAVALGRPWPYAAPALSSLGAIALIAGAPRLGALSFTASGAIMLLASASLAIRQFAPFTLALCVGAACWMAGSAYWLLGGFTPAVTGWWLSFLVVTVAAERLELSRMLEVPRTSQLAFALATLALLVGSARGEFDRTWAPLTAAGLLGYAAWLLHYDIARRTVRLPGLPRFSAVSILIGHVWLGVAGLLLLIIPPGTTAFSYDAAVHTIAIGFVLSMIFGHAPIILPAVAGIRVRFSRFAYASLVLLHLSLAMRLAGDIFERGEWRALSAAITILALAGYAATLTLASTTRLLRPIG